MPWATAEAAPAMGISDSVDGVNVGGRKGKKSRRSKKSKLRRTGKKSNRS